MSVLVGKKAPAVAGKAVVNGNEIVDNFSLENYRSCWRFNRFGIFSLEMAPDTSKSGRNSGCKIPDLC
ncbi:MAG: hypothetical protein H6Q19_1357 [Bacteroidetes bacterium]|nr:hypothetical protein [Bacteroidota bacterium]